MEVLELRLLGTVEAVASGRPVCLDGTKPRTALATLALTPGRTVPDDRLAAMLWGGRPPATASAQLYTYMSRLRRRLGPAVRLLRRPPGYQIDLGATR
ncbi:MAG TPA: winged helix-turn-helix domain-containing protein, partial [Actinophytocola sp.]|nr:winged helix-turn-helix domain-containing protein [Actinophytocola sp.]